MAHTHTHTHTIMAAMTREELDHLKSDVDHLKSDVEQLYKSKQMLVELNEANHNEVVALKTQLTKQAPQSENHDAATQALIEATRFVNKTKLLIPGDEREVLLVYVQECGRTQNYLISQGADADTIIGQWLHLGTGQPLPFLITGRVSPHDNAEYPRLMQWNDQADFEELAVKDLVEANVDWDLDVVGFVPSWNSGSRPILVWKRKEADHDSDEEESDDETSDTETMQE